MDSSATAGESVFCVEMVPKLAVTIETETWDVRICYN